MNIEDLAGQKNNQHRETQARLIKLDEDVADVRENVIKIESTMQTKDVCERHRNGVHDSIRRAGMWNKIAAFIATVAAGIVAYLGFRGGK